MNYEPEDYSIFVHRYKGDYIATCLEFGPGINVVEDTREAALREIPELTIDPPPTTPHSSTKQHNTYRFEHDHDTS